MKIAHFQVDQPKAESRIAALTACIERIRGVAGVVAVRSVGLFTVLYDERRIDPVTISDAVVAAAVQLEVQQSPEPSIERRTSTMSTSGIPARL
jgi:hypothetical protein